MRTRLLFGAIPLILAAWVHPCRADIIFDLSPASSTVSQGSLIRFFADVINTGADVTLDSLSATFIPDLDRTEDFTPFFNNFFGPLPSGTSIPASGPQLEIYDLTVNLTATPGVYSGLLTLNDPDGIALADQTFTVTVTALPEPGEFVLYGAGLVGLIVWKRRQRLEVEPLVSAA
jgi:hypothetical protein